MQLCQSLGVTVVMQEVPVVLHEVGEGGFKLRIDDDLLEF
jgi:hypothetical protein